MAKKHVEDYDELIKELENLLKTIEQIEVNANRLQWEADSAKNTLNDDIAGKSVESLKSVGAAIQKEAKANKEFVAQQIGKYKKEKAAVDEMSKM